MTCDLLILGAGPGGCRAALEAASLGMHTVLADEGAWGGTCLNAGCIPTKFLMGGTTSLDLFATQKKYKAAEGGIHFSLPALQNRKDKYVKGSRDALRKRLEAAGITLAQGRAAFAGPDRVLVRGQDDAVETAFKKCLIATGSTPLALPGLAPDGDCVLDSTSLLALTEAPESLIIVGGGVIGLEMGDIFQRFGTRITLVEALPRIAATEDEDVSDLLAKYHQRSGWTILTGRKVVMLRSEGGESVLRFDDGKELRAAKTLVAVGRAPAAGGLNLETAGVGTTERGFVRVDAKLRAAESIYAAGDVTGRALLAHAAAHQAAYAVEHMAGKIAHPYSDNALPSCIYGNMEAMRVGPTARALQAQGNQVYVSVADLAGNAISQSYGAAQGFVKVAWVGGTVRSVCAVGHGVSHLVMISALAVAQQWTKDTVKEIIFAHPTLDEALESAMLAQTILLE
jgi:dihydrolipoamide dehydrogenase